MTAVRPLAQHDRNGVEVLSVGECIRLLGSVAIARVGVTADALPVVVPVNIAVATVDPARGPEVIIRTVEGTKLLASLRHAVIAIEADSLEPVTHSGWSVLVRGTSRVIADPVELAAAEQLPLRPWAIPAANRYIAVGLDLVTGRRVIGWHRPEPPSRTFASGAP
jgi:hypothetical protein